jgi:hypothetical protein
MCTGAYRHAQKHWEGATVIRSQEAHGHASHECNVYAKDKRLSRAIFGLWKRLNSTSSFSRSAAKVDILSSRKLGSIAAASSPLFCPDSHCSTDILVPVYSGLLQALDPPRPLCPPKLRQPSIEPVRALLPSLASFCNEKGESRGRRTHPTDFYSDTDMRC